MRAVILWILLAMATSTGSAVVADEMLSESDAIAKIEKLGGKVIDGRPRQASVQYVPIPTAVIPYWAIVTPLILLSAYLLLAKPRSSKANGSVSASDHGANN